MGTQSVRHKLTSYLAISLAVAMPCALIRPAGAQGTVDELREILGSHPPGWCTTKAPLECSGHLGNIIGENAPAEEISLPNLMVYNEIFHRACAMHDRCYRFGYETYGITRTECDDNFYNDMKDACHDDAGDWVLAIVTVGASLASCLSHAFLYYGAVQNFGQGSFKRDDGACCDYLRRPPTGSSCQLQQPPVLRVEEEVPSIYWQVSPHAPVDPQ